MTCRRRPCEPLGCSHPLTPAGHCCPTCQGRTAPALPAPSGAPRESPGLTTVTLPLREPHRKPAPCAFLTLHPCPPVCPCCHPRLTVVLIKSLGLVLPELPALKLSRRLPNMSHHQTQTHSMAPMPLSQQSRVAASFPPGFFCPQS